MMKPIVLLLFGLLLSACSVSTAAPPACGNPAKSGMQEGSLRFGMLERSYNIYVPKGWDNQSAGPMVLGLHGGYGTGAIFDEQTKASKWAERYNMLLLLPDGAGRSWNAGTCCKPAARMQVRDVAFIETLVKQISQQYCVDDKRIFATGFSNGAMLTHRIACESPGLLDGIAPVSGGIMHSCENANQVPALLIQGREDPRIFWDGGEFDGSYRPAMREVVANLAKRNRCAAEEKTSSKQAGLLNCWTKQSCEQGEIRYCAVRGVGHQWPGGKTYWPKKLGPNTQKFDATEEIFRFFDQLSNKIAKP